MLAGWRFTSPCCMGGYMKRFQNGRAMILLQSLCICAFFVVLILWVFNNLVDSRICNGDVIHTTANVASFWCSQSFGNEYSEGGSWTDIYKCVLKDNKMHIFYTYCSTTGDNGMTTEYIKNLDDATHDAILKEISSNAWGKLYKRCNKLVSEAEERNILTEGMNDRESKNADGSYKWEEYFNELAEIY